MTAISLKQCKFSYPNHSKLVINIDQLTIESGEKVFLYGPSGHGKSTLLNLTAGVLKASSGEVSVLGQDLTKLSQSKRDHLRGEKIGYIFQIFNLIPYLTVKENIVLPCMINKKRADRDFHAQAEELVDSLGLREHINKKVTDLSIGQQQRVAAARALIGNPEMIIADEPTSALDEKNTREFMELLMKVWEKKKFTLIFVSHDERLKSYFTRSISLPEINHHD
ncbi:ABC transporter ATP-binding protein [Bacteriovorax stolpii]|uniref:Methionine ABC transporter ATP-binding protein n=1 Tax=Bacteriovorax stolpii TaxID=960 RepID=A0A2K9NT51_BACTC|nr:ABC transporter ATP-binding protein [Bacteriovorax stolpii]AUN98699.1 methionine ABC transporter ATP-binding protein [Bacteriovorax stolpii]QDK41321.1 ABC transporter ATP-binding protein [Bacteriovorax stolpii]TDP55792.1 putative ABC transport system ATP-binding protein [Bacteriovorax stolpii]